MQEIANSTEIARHALALMEEALRLLDLAGEDLAACHLSEAIDRLGRGASAPAWTPNA